MSKRPVVTNLFDQNYRNKSVARKVDDHPPLYNIKKSLSPPIAAFYSTSVLSGLQIIPPRIQISSPVCSYHLIDCFACPKSNQTRFYSRDLSCKFGLGPPSSLRSFELLLYRELAHLLWKVV